MSRKEKTYSLPPQGPSILPATLKLLFMPTVAMPKAAYFANVAEIREKKSNFFFQDSPEVAFCLEIQVYQFRDVK